jgi:3-keto-5-aminohexanoate cleavage enzyme
MISIHETGSISNAKRFLIDTRIVQKPYLWGILPALPGLLYMDSCHSMIESLSLVVNRIKEIDENSIIMVCNAGRASIYLVVLSLLMGLHVRVGMEDTIWKYPHKDDRMRSNAESVRTACEVAKILGRRVATGDEYRKLIGIKK